MLVLKRKLGEVIVVTGPDGTETRIMLVEAEHRQARLGFEAPPGVTIDRLEVYEAKKNNPRQEELTDAERQKVNYPGCEECGQKACHDPACSQNPDYDFRPPSYHPRPR